MKHWTEEDIISWLYGVQEDSTHLEQCALCLSKATQARNSRREVVGTPGGISAEFLATQRRAIFTRIELRQSWIGRLWSAQPGLRYRMAASLALFLLVAVMSFNLLQRPAYVPLASPADERLYSDMVAIDESNVPRALQPIQNLFEE